MKLSENQQEMLTKTEKLYAKKTIFCLVLMIINAALSVCVLLSDNYQYLGVAFVPGAALFMSIIVLNSTEYSCRVNKILLGFDCETETPSPSPEG